MPTKNKAAIDIEVRDDKPLFSPNFSSLLARGENIMVNSIAIVRGAKKDLAETNPSIRKYTPTIKANATKSDFCPLEKLMVKKWSTYN